LYPDTEHPILSDLRVREAIHLAINRRQIADEVYGGAAEAISNILVIPEEFVSPNTTVDFSPERARELLDEAGWIDEDEDGVRERDGEPLQLDYYAIIDPINRQIQEIVRSNLADIGIDLRINVVDAGIFFGGDQTQNDTVEKFPGDIQHWNTPMPGIDPVTYLGYWTEGQIPTPENGWVGFNSARWYSEEYNELYQQAITEIDLDARRELVIEMNDLLVGARWVLPIVRIAASAKAPDIQNVELTPWDAETWQINEWYRAEEPADEDAPATDL
jgi:peptide/nickel transport system substrate-binding protein